MDKKAAGVDAGKKNSPVVKEPPQETKKHGVAADIGGSDKPVKDPCKDGPKGGC